MSTNCICCKCYIHTCTMVLVYRAHQVQRHGEVKRHACKDCGKTFSHYHQYKLHLAQHKKGFTCPSCSKVYHKQQDLREHIKVKHPPKPKNPQLNCDQPGCEYTCYSRYKWPSSFRVIKSVERLDCLIG